MTVEEVRSADDPRVVDYRHLTDVGLRRRLEPAVGLFMAESHQVIDRAVTAGYQPRSVLTTRRWLPAVAALELSDDVTVLVADEQVINAITGYRVHRGALAAMERQPLPSVDDVVASARRLLVLEGIVDHANVGALFRTAAALGFDGCLIDPTCADPLYRRSVRVSMGAVFALPWTRVDHWPHELDGLRAQGFELLALTPRREALPLDEVAKDPPHRLALLFGTEGAGLSAAALSMVERQVRIPMASGIDSLNVAAAAAVACYVVGRDRQGGDRMEP